MPQLQLLSPSEQVAEFLRGELLEGRWTDTIPGAPSLAKEFGVDRKTVDAALRLLDAEGLLLPQGPGRRRRITLPEDRLRAPSLRVGILLHEAENRSQDYLVEILHLLTEAGHAPIFASKSMVELGMDVDRVSRHIRRSPADAWIVFAGSLDILSWFARQPFETFAAYGNLGDLEIAGTGPAKSPAYRDAVRELAGCGHRRVVLLARPQRRTPEPGVPEQAFLDALEAEGIEVGDYHLPNWDGTTRGFRDCLESLFRVTPPTALIAQELELFNAAYQFLSRKGLQVPEDVSLICADHVQAMDWCDPTIAHFEWDNSRLSRRVVRWTNNVSRNKEDRRYSNYDQARFVSGGTVGPAKA